MNRILFSFVVSAILCGVAPAQQKAKSPAPAAPVLAPAVSAVTDEIAYPLPLAERDKFRDLQHENDQIEIENQKMLIKIEQNKARQAALVGAEQLIAWQFAQSAHIDLGINELDPGQIRFVKKKAAIK